MRRPEELDSMLKHADHQVKLTQSQWAKGREQTALARQRLQELQSYTNEYGEGARTAVSVTDLLNRNQFVARLQEAVAQQERALQHARQTEAALHARWLERQQNLAALERLKERRQQALMAEKDRREQRALDEFALRSLWPQA